MVHLNSGILLSVRKDEILPFVTTWVDLRKYRLIVLVWVLAKARGAGRGGVGVAAPLPRKRPGGDSGLCVFTKSVSVSCSCHRAVGKLTKGAGPLYAFLQLHENPQ